MNLNELQLCLTTVCNIRCDYCHLDKKSKDFVSEEVVTKTISLAKKNNVSYLRVTGGDVFEHPFLEKILKMIKTANLKIILNVSFDRYSNSLKIKDLFDILLVSFQSLAQLENLNLNKLNKEVMGCIVFQESWLKNLKKLSSLVNSLNFSSFFFLREVNNSSKSYFTKLNECVERTLQLTKKISFANAFPLCFVAKKNIDFCSGKRFDNGNERLYITPQGYIKPSAYSNITLGNVTDIHLYNVYKENQERVQAVQNRIRVCKDCKIKDYCGSGILTKNDYSKDPFLKHVFFNKYPTKLQKKIKEVLPNPNLKVDLKTFYYLNSGFFMRYPPSEYWKPTKKQDLNPLLWVESQDINLYLHFPFCDGFCDFCKIQKFDNSERDFYSEFLISEIESFSNIISANNISSIYFGGGSPQLMGLDNAKKVFAKLFSLINNKVAEVNFEFFPKNFDKEFMVFLKKYVNRISLGIQCFDDETLKRVGRNISKNEMIEFINKTKELNFSVLNFDIIYGLYSPIPTKFESDIKEILEFNPDQITFQPLHYIKDVGFADFVNNEPELNSSGRKLLKEFGYTQLSSEDFSKNSKLIYQEALLGRKNILGIGKGAFGILNNICFKNDNQKNFFYKLTKTDKLYAKLFLSSRLFNFNIRELNKEFGLSYKALFSDSLRYLLKNKFIEINKDKLLITESGKEYVDLVCNLLSLSNLDLKK